MTITVNYDPPPIPLRVFDWCAVDENYDEGSPAGYGQTKYDAVRDLLDQLEEIDDANAE